MQLICLQGKNNNALGYNPLFSVFIALATLQITKNRSPLKREIPVHQADGK
jgi:hypothetical protein